VLDQFIVADSHFSTSSRTCNIVKMDSVRTTREETTLAESVQPVPRTFLITAALVVLVHSVVMLVHGAAHMQLNIELSPWTMIYVLGIVGAGPITGLLFLRSSWQRTGVTILFITMMGGLLFGLWNHFIANGADHVMHLQPGSWRLPFQVTAGLLACSEAAGVVIAFALLRALNTEAKALARACSD
jgi:hypothetical protein